MGTTERHPDLLESDGHKLRFLNKRLGGCKGVCDSCDCAGVMRSVLDSRRRKLEDVMHLPVLPKEFRADAERMRDNQGESSEEREDYLYIRACRPIPDSFGAVSDDEL